MANFAKKTQYLMNTLYVNPFWNSQETPIKRIEMSYINKNVVLVMKTNKILIYFGSTMNKLFIQRAGLIMI